jgi:hypothetical protein
MKQIFWKVQTLPQTKELEVGSKEFNLYKEKYQEYNKLETDEDVLKDYYTNSSKNPLWGKIYSISLGFVDEATNSARIKVFKGDEKDIIQEFLNTCNEHFKASKMVGYNLSFLLPFLRSRMLKNGMSIQGLPQGLIDLGMKPWTMQGICLQDYFNGIGWFKNSLEETAFLLNLETNFIDGKDVYSYFLAEKEEELNKSIIDETFTLINCYRIIQGEKPCEELNSTVVVLENVKEIEVSLLQRIYKAVSIDSATKEKIEQKLNKAKLTKKDKEIVEDILTSLYVNNTMFSSDKPEIKEQKKLEIKQLVNDK